MSTFFLVLIILAVIATLVALIRGLITFLKTTEQDLMGTGPSVSGLKQNRMMRARIGFQALAIVLVVLFLLISQSK